MGADKFFYYDAEKHLPNPFLKTGRRIVADATWMAAGGWQMLGDMPRGKNIQHGLQNMVWHMQDAAWGMQEKIDVVRDRLQQQSVRRQQNRAHKKLQLMAFARVPLDRLALVLQHSEFAVLSQETKDAFLREVAQSRSFQDVQGEEAVLAASILGRSAQTRR